MFSLLLIVAVGIIATNIFADIITENDVELELNSDLTYYLTVQEDGIDVDGVESSDTQMANLTSGRISVTDRIPDGLVFQGFVTTSNGVIGASSRADSSVSCSGVVVDDTHEASVDAGTWNNNNTEFYYHGLHYDANTRTVSFMVEKLKAGCELTVGIITKTPTSVDDPTTPAVETRRDFYNNALASEKDLTSISNTVHGFIGSPNAITYPVSYAYTGDIPSGAPAAPTTQDYPANAAVTVATSPSLVGYTFSGWTTPDATVTNNSFSMPEQAVNFVGIWVQDIETIKHTVTYIIEGDAPSDFLAPAPKDYVVDSQVSLEDIEPGTIIDGYRFLGWTSTDATITGSGFTMPDNDVVIRGSFERVSYTVCYRFEGAVLPPNHNSLLPACTNHYPGDTVTTAATPTAEGYEFIGWYKNATFTMPEKNVVIYGEWSLAPAGKFAPTITKTILNPEDAYMFGETVEFKISVTNTAEYAIRDVYVSELLDGATFHESQNNSYDLVGTDVASISSIAPGATVDIFASYTVHEDKDQTLTNSVELIGALADNNRVLDNSQDYVASVSFTTEAQPAPLTGIITNPAIYIGLIIAALIGVFATKIAPKCNLRVARRIMRRVSPALNYVKMVAIPARVAGVILILSTIFGGIIIHNVIAENYTEVIKSISLTSAHTSFENSEDGAWNIVKSAEWVSNNTAEITFDVDTIAKVRDNAGLDTIMVIDTSGSMQGDKINQVKTDAVGLAEEVINNHNGRVAIVDFNTAGTIRSELTDNLSALTDAINNLTASGETNYNAGLTKASEVLENYQAEPGRKLALLFLTDGGPTHDTPNEIAAYRILKANYPDMLISGIQYEMDDELLEPIVRVSDQQFIATMGDLNNVLVSSLYEPIVYGDFVITDYINDDFWEVASASSISATAGSFELAEENGVQSVTWDLSEGFVTGASAQLTITVHLKENVDLNNNPFLPTNKHESVVSSLVDMPGENIDSTSTPVLKAGYNVTYEANLPSGCSSYNGTLPEGGTYVPLSVVLVPADAISCDGYNFMGWQDTNGSYGLLNGNYIRLKNNDVALKAIWSKVSIKKSMDGTIHDGSVARLKAGPDVNVALKRLVDPNVSTYDDSIDGLRAIKTANSMSAQQEANAVIISSAESEYPIYAWFDDNDGTVYIYTEASTIMGNPDMSRLFQGIWELADASGVADWDMSETTNLDVALAMTGFLDLDDFANWDVSNVQSMEMLLYVDWQLEDISGLANWDVGNVTNMWGTFSGTERVTDLSPLADWDVGKVEDMGYMFYGNMAIEDIDALADWDTSNVMSFRYMFGNAVELTSVEGALDWNTDSLLETVGMFSNTPSLTDLHGLENWNTINVEDMNSMFDGSGITDVDELANWKTDNVGQMYGMFANATNLTDIDGLANWNTGNVQTMSSMFYDTAITNVDALADWNTGNVLHMNYMFQNASDLTDISGLSGWNTSSATTMASMFQNATGIQNINALSNWNTGNVTSMESMFYGATALTDISGASGWNVSNVEYLSYMFANDSLITYLKTLDGWDTSSVIEKGNMFLNIPGSVRRPIWWNL